MYLSVVWSLGSVSCSLSYWKTDHTLHTVSTQEALGTVRDAVKKKKTHKMSLLYMKTKLPECISLNVLLALLANYLCHSRYNRPSFLAQKKLKKDPTHVADSILIFYCSQYIFRAYLVCSNQWHIYSSSSYLTYFSLCSIFSLYKAHVSWQKKWIV